ncbi:hypothetical protein CANMA_004407 [Candida margitis]|uniref:uncharacterized protein n=1 Tax=Candida margitis TaxID=1775924 RepID=UPI002227A470|nr:uncharacterized protein CANMA_004407 [Candida margitis]KAI5957403.1 hypothetical protein CANMA_004407 [Candida margitis]
MIKSRSYLLESHIRDTSPVRNRSGLENSSMELESCSFSIDVDNTPTRVNYPPLEEYSQCILRNSNFRIINEGMIPRVLPEPGTALDSNGGNAQSLPNMRTPRVNMICSSPFVSKMGHSSAMKGSSPVVCALPDDLAKSNEVYRHIYGSSSFTESPIIRRNSTVRTKLNQEYGASQAQEASVNFEANTSWKKSNTSSVMSIESIINPVSPKKERQDANGDYQSQIGYYGVNAVAGLSDVNLIEEEDQSDASQVSVGGDEHCEDYEEDNSSEYDQYIVTIKLPSKLLDEALNIDCLGVRINKKLPITCGEDCLGRTKKRRLSLPTKKKHRFKNTGKKHRATTSKKESHATISKSKASTSETTSSLSKRARSKGYDSDEEYLPHEASRTPQSRKRVQRGPDGVAKKRKCVIRSKSGCWTCRIRHKGCNEEQPKCGHCQRLNLTCDYSPVRPAYMVNEKLHAEKLLEIRRLTDQVKKRAPRY